MTKMLIKQHRRLCPHSNKHGTTVNGFLRRGRRKGYHPNRRGVGFGLRI